MAETTKTIMSFCATVSDRVKDLVIKDGQLIFIHDEGRIAMDYKGKRTFYNQVIEIEAEQERIDLSDPINGKYYFVIETAVFWRYYNGWQQLTTAPDEILFIGTEMPELGQPKKLYIDKTENNESISIWDEETESYKVVADKTQTISAEEIAALF